MSLDFVLRTVRRLQCGDASQRGRAGGRQPRGPAAGVQAGDELRAAVGGGEGRRVQKAP